MPNSLEGKDVKDSDEPFGSFSGGDAVYRRPPTSPILSRRRSRATSKGKTVLSEISERLKEVEEREMELVRREMALQDERERMNEAEKWNKLTNVQQREAEVRSRLADLTKREKEAEAILSEYEPKMRELKHREARLLKKDRETMRACQEIDRRMRKLQEEEAKYGTVVMREVEAARKEGELEVQNNKLARRRRELKDMEDELKVKDQDCTTRTQTLKKLKTDLNLLQTVLAQREERVVKGEKLHAARKAELEKAEAKSKEWSAQLQSQEEALHEKEERLRSKEEALIIKERELRDTVNIIGQKDAHLKKREEGVSNMNFEVQGKLAQLSREREELEVREAALQRMNEEVQESKRDADMKLSEMRRKQVEMGEREAAVERLEEVAAQKVSQATKRLVDIQRQVEDLDVREKEVASRGKRLDEREVQLQHADQRVTATAGELSDREVRVRVQEDVIARGLADLAEREAKCTAWERRLEEREHELDEIRSDMEAKAAQAESRAKRLKERNERVRQHEAELLDWMKEMRQREALLSKCESRGTASFPRPSGGKRGMSSGVNIGKSLVDVQLRRLKDQYVATLKRMWYQKPGKDEGEEALLDIVKESEEASQVAQLRREYNATRRDFRRLIARVRAFDSDESPEKDQQLELFTVSERTAVEVSLEVDHHLGLYDILESIMHSSPIARNPVPSNDEAVAWWAASCRTLSTAQRDALQNRLGKLRRALNILQSKVAALGITPPARDITWKDESDVGHPQVRTYPHAQVLRDVQRRRLDKATAKASSPSRALAVQPRASSAPPTRLAHPTPFLKHNRIPKVDQTFDTRASPSLPPAAHTPQHGMHPVTLPRKRPWSSPYRAPPVPLEMLDMPKGGRRGPVGSRMSGSPRLLLQEGETAGADEDGRAEGKGSAEPSPPPSPCSTPSSPSPSPSPSSAASSHQSGRAGRRTPPSPQ